MPTGWGRKTTIAALLRGEKSREPGRRFVAPLPKACEVQGMKLDCGDRSRGPRSPALVPDCNSSEMNTRRGPRGRQGVTREMFMADDKSKPGPDDAAWISVNEDLEVRHWTKEFGCTRTELEDAVRVIGPMASKVREYLAKAK